jgi:NitT/TauT family transport system ATP-binding protein
LALVLVAPGVVGWLWGLVIAAFGLDLRKPEMEKAARRDRAAKELARVGLAGDAHKMPAMLSGGERQRVALARALALDPEIILMDEPFSALDPETRGRLRRQIVDLWRETGKTVLFVTHDMEEALELADRIVVFSNKPTRVREVFTVSAARPRDVRADAELRAMRAELVKVFRDMGEQEGKGDET